MQLRASIIVPNLSNWGGISEGTLFKYCILNDTFTLWWKCKENEEFKDEYVYNKKKQ